MSEKRNVPKLRFQGFNCDWIHSTIREIATKVTDGTHDTPKPTSSGIPFITAIHVKDGYVDFGNCYFLPQLVHQKIYSRCNPEFGDLLMVNIGSGTGTCAMVDVEYEFSLKNIALIKPDRSTIDSRYLAQIQRESSSRLKHRLSAGGAQPFLSLNEIGKIKLRIPSLPEQQKIAGFLTAVDRRIELLQAKKEKLEVYKKGVMQKIFPSTSSGQVPELRFKADDGSDFPDWEEQKLREVAKFSKGKGISKSDISQAGTQECIRYGELYTEYAEVIDVVISRTELDQSGLVLSQANDVIIPSSGETQLDIARASCVLRSGIALGGDLNIIRSTLNGVFLSFYLNHRRKHQIAKMAQGISVVHLYNSQLQELEIEIPCLDEQRKIVQFLTSLDKSIENLNQQITYTQTWKKGLLQKMFV